MNRSSFWLRLHTSADGHDLLAKYLAVQCNETFVSLARRSYIRLGKSPQPMQKHNKEGNQQQPNPTPETAQATNRGPGEKGNVGGTDRARNIIHQFIFSSVKPPQALLSSLQACKVKVRYASQTYLQAMS